MSNKYSQEQLSKLISIEFEKNPSFGAKIGTLIGNRAGFHLVQSVELIGADTTLSKYDLGLGHRKKDGRITDYSPSTGIIFDVDIMSKEFLLSPESYVNDTLFLSSFCAHEDNNIISVTPKKKSFYDEIGKPKLPLHGVEYPYYTQEQYDVAGKVLHADKYIADGSTSKIDLLLTDFQWRSMAKSYAVGAIKRDRDLAHYRYLENGGSFENIPVFVLLANHYLNEMK